MTNTLTPDDLEAIRDTIEYLPTVECGTAAFLRVRLKTVLRNAENANRATTAPTPASENDDRCRYCGAPARAGGFAPMPPEPSPAPASEPDNEIDIDNRPDCEACCGSGTDPFEERECLKCCGRGYQ